MSRRIATALALAATALAVTGCTAGEKQAAAPASTPTSAGPGPACGAAPSPTESWMGGWAGPLPDEIRCLPHVADGTYSSMPAETSVTGRASYTVAVHVADDTTRDQAKALCRRITELGYGPGGSHDIALLTVSGSGSYTSTPGGPACLEGN